MESEGKPYAIVNSSNIVTSVVLWDGNTSTWSPESGTCVGIDTDFYEFVGIGMTYNSGGTGIGTTSSNKWIVQ